MKKSEQKLSLKLPDETLSVLRCYGICPEWFATEVCTNFFRDMMEDEDNFIAIMQAWAEHKGLDLEGITEKVQEVAAAA